MGGSPDAGGQEALRLSWDLLRACYEGDRGGALLALQAGADPNRAVGRGEALGLPRPSPPIPYHWLVGRSPLGLAARRGAAVIAIDLMLSGADANAKGERGRSPLHEAAESGDCETIKALLMGGADPKAVDEWGGGALACAAFAWSANPEAVALLIQSGAGWEGVDEEGEREAKETYDSWDASGQSSWELDPRVRALLLSARESEMLEGGLGPGRRGAPRAL